MAPRFDHYHWAGGREPMLRFGPHTGPVAVLALPLFEEANRTRAFGVAILRALAVRGIGGVLPELPGQGESEAATADASLAVLRSAYAAAAAGNRPVAIRSGALLVDGPAWLLAPQTGAALLRELTRVKGAALAGERMEVGGNLLSASLIQELTTASFHPDPGRGGRVVRLSADPEPADRHVDAAPLWRRAEPDSDPATADLLAADIAAWFAACAG